MKIDSYRIREGGVNEVIANEEVEADKDIIIVPHKPDSFALGPGRAAYHKDGDILFRFGMQGELTIPGYKSVCASEYLGDMLIKRALEQLDKYVADHLEDVEMYKYDSFWKGALLKAGRIIIPGEPSVLTPNVNKGILNVYTCGILGFPYRCCYDMAQKRMYLEYESWQRAKEEAPQNFMDYLFAGDQRYILAQRQYDEGLIPAPYMELYLEISRINRFLEGRRSVNAVFGEDKKLLCYPRGVQTAAFLIKLDGTRFVNYHYNFRREMGEQIVGLDEKDGLPCKLTHYSDELEIDTEVFEGIDIISSPPVDNDFWKRPK